VKPAPFTYVRAESVEHAVDTLRAHGGEAKPLAGGQSLVPALNMRLARPTVLVDLNRIAGLAGIDEENGDIRIGALVRQSAAERAQLVRERCPLLVESLPLVGHFVTRNRGTIGGSIAHADAAAELPLALVALAGSVVTTLRTIPAADFFVGHFTTALAEDELVLATTWPQVGSGEGSAIVEFAPRHGDFALASAACVLRVENGAVAEGRLAVGSVTERPELVDVEPLLGSPLDDDRVRSLGARAAAAVDPPPNLHGSPDYRRALLATLVERALRTAWARATETSP
jgi:aerobic carbon-monoxide dehydrogenase medium subunit